MSRSTYAPEAEDAASESEEATKALDHPCPCCGGRMIVIETFEAGSTPRHGLQPEGIDSS